MPRLYRILAAFGSTHFSSPPFRAGHPNASFRDSEHYPPEGKLRVYRSKVGGNDWEALTKGLPQQDCYVNILRDAMAVDRLDPCGIYFGTTGGQVYGSPDGGDSWTPIVRDLPAVLSVEVQTLP